MIYARQSTAIIVTVGPVLDADGVAVTDGVVGDFKISKNGGAPAALNGSATLTHRNTGHYSLSLTATDVNTVGTVEVVIDDTVNACPMKEITVLEEAIYDAYFAASANAWSGAAGSTTLTALASGSITAAVIATGAIDADAIADNAIDAGALAADCITAAKIADGAIDAATFAADVDAEILSYLVDDATRIDASALNTASGAIGSNGSGLTEAGGTGDHLTAVPWNASWDAEVQSEAEDALAAYHVVLVKTTIASLSSQTSFTLTAGSADNDAYNDCEIVIEDASTAAQKAVAVVDDYTGASKTVTLRTDPAVFTMATGDIVTIRASRALKPTVMNRTLDVTATGGAGIDWNNVENPTTTLNLSGTTVKTATDVETDTQDIQGRLPAALVSGRIDASVGAMAANTLTASALASDAVTEIQSGLSTLTAANVQTECEEALQTYHLDHLIASADPGSVVADSSFLAKLVSKSATPAFSSYSNQTDSLEAIRDRGDAAWITATGFSTHSAADVWSVATRVLTAGTNIQLPSNGLDLVTLPANIITATSIAANAITAAKIATDAIDADAIAADAVTEIQSGLSTLTAAGVRTAVGLASANLDTQLDALPTAAENATAVLTTQMTEAYNSDGAAPTLAQSLFVVMQMLVDKSISGTTVTVKKIDGSTTAYTCTLDSATTPTSIARAT